MQWKDLPPEAATWEPLAVFQESFPHFHLEDKVFSKAGGVDTVTMREEERDGDGGEANKHQEGGIASTRPRREIKKPARYR